MIIMRHYQDTGTDLDLLYKSIVEVLRSTEGLGIARELVGDAAGKPFRSVVAASVSIPAPVVGALREVTITITGGTDDFVVEVHTGVWFNALTMPGIGGVMPGGPLGPAGSVADATGMGAEFHATLSDRVN